MKLLANSHLWWPRLDIGLKKMAKSCSAYRSIKQAQAAAPLKSMGVAFQTLATGAHRLYWPIHGWNVPIVGGCPFQVG